MPAERVERNKKELYIEFDPRDFREIFPSIFYTSGRIRFDLMSLDKKLDFLKCFVKHMGLTYSAEFKDKLAASLKSQTTFEDFVVKVGPVIANAELHFVRIYELVKTKLVESKPEFPQLIDHADFETWCVFNEKELDCIFAESGADREMDFDREAEEMKIWESDPRIKN